MIYTSDGVASSAAYAVDTGTPETSMVSVISSDAILMPSIVRGYSHNHIGCGVIAWLKSVCAVLAVCAVCGIAVAVLSVFRSSQGVIAGIMFRSVIWESV